MWIEFWALLLLRGLVLVPEVIYKQRLHKNGQGWKPKRLTGQRLRLILILRIRSWETSLSHFKQSLLYWTGSTELGFTANSMTPLQNWNYNKTYHHLAWNAAKMLNMKEIWGSHWEDTQTLPESESLCILSKSSPQENKEEVAEVAMSS